MLSKLRRIFLGAPLNPFSRSSRKHISLIAYGIASHSQGIITIIPLTLFPRWTTLLKQPVVEKIFISIVINPQLPTAMIFINNISTGVHTLMSIQRLFPGQFKKFVFLGAGIVDVESFRGMIEFEERQAKVNCV